MMKENLKKFLLAGVVCGLAFFAVSSCETFAMFGSSTEMKNNNKDRLKGVSSLYLDFLSEPETDKNILDAPFARGEIRFSYQ